MLRHPSLIPLSHHHQHGLAACVLIERGLATDRSPESASKLAGKVRDLFELELRNHFAIEERVLFPAIRERLGSYPLVEELVADHRELESLAVRVAAVSPVELPDALLAFVRLLERHIRREERELFEDIQRRLPAETLDQLGKVISRDAVQVCWS